MTRIKGLVNRKDLFSRWPLVDGVLFLDSTCMLFRMFDVRWISKMRYGFINNAFIQAYKVAQNILYLKELRAKLDDLKYICNMHTHLQCSLSARTECIVTVQLIHCPLLNETCYNMTLLSSHTRRPLWINAFLLPGQSYSLNSVSKV